MEKQSISSGDIRRYLDSRKKIIDTRLEKLLELDKQDKRLLNLYESMRYSTLAKGKRIRPIFTIAVFELYKKDIKEVIDPACAIEMIHAAALMLDDMPCMDDAKYRRGKKTNHLVFGESTTILASSALWAVVFKILSDIKSTEINDIVREIAGCIGHTGLAGGQILDLQSFSQLRTIAELNKCYYLKTGALFENAVKLGARLGGANEKELKVLGKFGRDFGLAFQIRDDILDVQSTLSEGGKDIHVDLKNVKPTYVSLLGYEKSKKILSDMIDSLSRDLKQLPHQTNTLKEITNLFRVQ